MPKQILNRINIKGGFKFWPLSFTQWIKVLGYLFLLGLISALILIIYYTKDLPQPEIFNEVQINQATKIYDRTGKILLYQIGAETRETTQLSEIPDTLKKAIIAGEDANFYSHKGVDPAGLFRALKTFLTGKQYGGGSTLTQQLIRTTFLTQERTASRKIKEIVLSLQLEQKYSKDQILEWYMNRVPFCHNIYGVQQASKVYFGKTAKDLTLAESAVLAASIQKPCYFSPFGPHTDELKKRRDNYILERMAQEKFITREEADKSKSEELVFVENFESILAPHFSLYVRELLYREYGEDFLTENGLKIYTTLDWELQKEAERIVKEGAAKNEKYNAYNAAAVVIDPNSGDVLAMVGSKDFLGKTQPSDCFSTCLFDPQVNMTVYGNGRQPGSSFKPFAYVTAFKKGYDDKTVVTDELTNFGVWGGESYIPQNYDGLFRGPVTLRQALAQSLNIPAVKVLVNFAGINDTAKTAQNMGLTTLKPPFGPSIVLGGWEVKPLDMASAFGVFATEGIKYQPLFIKRIENANGDILKEYKQTPQRVLDEKPARMVNSILSDNEARAPMFGYRSNLYFPNYKVAAKTGTTNNFKDGWTVGYTPKTALAVWVGNNNNEPTKKLAEALAGPIFHQIMQVCLFNYPPDKEFTPPN